MKHPALQAGQQQGRLKGKRSYKGEANDISDRYGHGTHAAELILRFAPEAELYVAKVADGGTMVHEDTRLIVEVY